jgi:hypothetical protein
MIPGSIPNAYTNIEDKRKSISQYKDDQISKDINTVYSQNTAYTKYTNRDALYNFKLIGH